MVIIYGNNSWEKILHIGLLKNTEFVYYRDSSNINDINDIISIDGIKKVYIIQHGWYTIVLEMMNHNNIDKLYKHGFKLGIKTRKKYKILNKNGFYRIVEI
jgi:hypothetical protein